MYRSLSMELYLADTGQLLCHVDALKGAGSSEKYDEMGFVSIPPCLWSDNDASGQLPRPVMLPLNATLLSIKRANATWPHTGEMASWQMRGALVSKQGQQQDLEVSKVSRLRLATSKTEQQEDI